jgi:NADPH:quinone reductase-like Zn-dependent oxidoreductase
MDGIFHFGYGGLENLSFGRVAVPAPGPGEVLVRVRAASLHLADCMMVRGRPWLVRAFSGWRNPVSPVPGTDLAGEVIAVGTGVRRFVVGDAVLGIGRGACAEAALAPEHTLTHKPKGLSWQQAAALPTSGLAALHALRDAAKLTSGQHLLINGASGGIGCFAIQLAKHFGARVTTVCSTSNLDLARNLGADITLDYTWDDFTQRSEQFDVVLDNIENQPLKQACRALRPQGLLILNSGRGSGFEFYTRLVKHLLMRRFLGRRICRYFSEPNPHDLEILATLSARGHLRVIAGRTFRLAAVPAALAYVESGHVRGKAIIEVNC